MFNQSYWNPSVYSRGRRDRSQRSVNSRSWHRTSPRLSRCDTNRDTRRPQHVSPFILLLRLSCLCGINPTGGSRIHNGRRTNGARPRQEFPISRDNACACLRTRGVRAHEHVTVWSRRHEPYARVNAHGPMWIQRRTDVSRCIEVCDYRTGNYVESSAIEFTTRGTRVNEVSLSLATNGVFSTQLVADTILEPFRRHGSVWTVVIYADTRAVICLAPRCNDTAVSIVASSMGSTYPFEDAGVWQNKHAA